MHSISFICERNLVED